MFSSYLFQDLRFAECMLPASTAHFSTLKMEEVHSLEKVGELSAPQTVSYPRRQYISKCYFFNEWGF
jgi:hypothetical protein